jgi:tetratricopeptide (TPR) repeat protein
MYVYYRIGGHCKTLQDYNTLHHKSDSREVIMFQGFLILCLITIIGLSLLPTVFVLARAEKDVASGNDSTIYIKGLALDKLGNDTGAILYYDKALAIDPHQVNALNNKGLALDKLGNDTGAIFYNYKALAIQPSDTYALDHIGMALDNLGN